VDGIVLSYDGDRIRQAKQPSSNQILLNNIDQQVLIVSYASGAKSAVYNVLIKVKIFAAVWSERPNNLISSFIEIGQTVFKIWRFFDFQDGGHLGFVARVGLFNHATSLPVTQLPTYRRVTASR